MRQAKLSSTFKLYDHSDQSPLKWEVSNIVKEIKLAEQKEKEEASPFRRRGVSSNISCDTNSDKSTFDMSHEHLELKLSKLIFAEQNKKLQDKRAYEEYLLFMREWGMAKARRNADVAATIERKNNMQLSLLKDFAIMIKPNRPDPVDWTKIYLNEDEFLTVDKSIESKAES